MPYPNEHSCRLISPDKMRPDSYRRHTRKSKSRKKNYDVIVGRLKTTGKSVDQAYRYSIRTWNAGEARGHCRKHKGAFEPAAKEKPGN